MKIFGKQMHERCDANNSITIFEGIALLEKIHADYLYKKYKIAQQTGMPKLAFELINSIQFQIERSWLIKILKRNGISIKTSGKVEALRNRYCHSSILINFYSNFISIISQNSNTIFNADETASTFNEKGKVIVPDGKHPIQYSEKINYHFTHFACFNAAGNKVLKPFIIVLGLKKT